MRSKQEVEALIRPHLALPRHAVFKMLGSQAAKRGDVEDLIAEATHGLVLAAHRYDPKKGPFIRLAITYVYGYLKNALRLSDSMTPMGDGKAWLNHKRRGTAPVTISIHQKARIGGLSASSKFDDDEPELGEIMKEMAVEGHQGASMEQNDSRKVLQLVREGFKRKTARSRSHTQQRNCEMFLDYTFGDGTLNDVGAKYGVSRELVRQVVKRNEKTFRNIAREIRKEAA